MEHIDVTVIGGGIIGLMTAREIIKRNPHLTVCIFEKEHFLGDHSSGRNSGVLHAGIYYQYNSFKHRLCLEGNQKWESISRELDIPLRRCGKFVVAKNSEEDEELQKLYNSAVKNGVPFLRLATEEELDRLKESVHCYSAIYSPQTGIIDQGEAIKAIANDFEKNGGVILRDHEVVELSVFESDFCVEFSNSLIIKSKYLVNAAGLGGVTLRRLLGLKDLSNYFVRGSYIMSSKPNSFTSLIYPLPEKKLKGLGAHLTFDFHGKMKFGPDTEDVDQISYQINESRVESLKSAVKTLFKEIDLESLQPDYSGIRPKIFLNREIFSDFWIKSPIPNYLELLGIESPGFTASPGIARVACELLGLN